MGADSITLKWGSLKAWDIQTPAARDILRRWAELGTNASAMLHHDTAEQKALLCALIDASDVETVYLDWDGKDVSKDEAKAYIMGYGE